MAFFAPLKLRSRRDIDMGFAVEAQSYIVKSREGKLKFRRNFRRSPHTYSIFNAIPDDVFRVIKLWARFASYASQIFHSNRT